MTPTALLLSALLASANASPLAQREYYGAAFGLTPPLEKRGESAWRYAGCYVESSTRLLRGPSTRASDMTVNKCHQFCSGRRYAGLENGDECWCGDVLAPTDPGTNAGTKVDDRECGIPCGGDKEVVCGAPWRLALYESNLFEPEPNLCQPLLPGTGNGTGAVVSIDREVLTHSFDATGTSASASAGTEVPMLLTHAGPGSIDATLLNTASASASPSVTGSPQPLTHTGPDPILDATSATPSAPAATGSSSDSASSTSAILIDGTPWLTHGCVAASDARVLSSFAVLDQPNMTAVACLSLVGRKGYRYAALGLGHECYGGNVPAAGYGGSDECSYTCSDGRRCGGKWAVDLYQIGEGANASATAAGNGSMGPVASGAAGAAGAAGHVNNTLPPTSSTSASVNGAMANTTPIAPEIISGLAPPPPSSKPHKVWAHFMVGFTYAYTSHNWDVDIAAAKAAGIDGFALNMGTDPWQPKQVRMAYDAAKRAGGFEMFLSFDMNSLQCTTAQNATTLVEHVKAFAKDEVQAKWEGRVLVSTFAGQQCSFGRNETKPEVGRRDNATVSASTSASASASASAAATPPAPPPPVPDAWGPAFVDPLKASGIEIFFIPSLFLPPAQQASYAWLDGAFAWNSAWPGAANDTTSTTDSEYLAGLEPRGKLYVPALSPGFFAHYGPDSYDKNWIYKSDDWLYCSRWEALIALRARAPMLEIVTWNDFTESSYLAPYPNNASLDEHSPAWVEGMDHEPLQALTKFYSDAYKTGSYPEIEEDSLVLWSRPHPKDATARNDTVPRPKDADLADDALYAVVLAKAPARVTIYSGKNEHAFDVPQGLSKIRIPSAPGTIGGYVERNGVKTTQYDSGGRFEYTDKPEEYNFNFYVGASSDPGQMIKSFVAAPPK